MNFLLTTIDVVFLEWVHTFRAVIVQARLALVHIDGIIRVLMRY